jgi:small GTP-binding protein
MSSEAALSTYTGVKLRLAAVLETLLYFAHERKDEVRARFIQELLADLAEDNFRLAVFGKYNRGKSTLMNALLGMDRLPTGILPLTSVVTTVRYDAQERVQIFREGWALPQDIPMSELSEYVTEQGNPGNEKRVTLAQVFLPAGILRYGFFLIDTPGLGSSIAANTKAAEAFIPRADAAIVVMSVESPLDEEDWALLERAHTELKRVFVVLNKTDLLSEHQRNSVIDAVSRRLQALYAGAVRVFPLSARNALARAESSSGKEQDRELRVLMEALLDFVKREKTAQFLNRMAERVQSLIQDEKALEYLAHREGAEKQRLVERVQEKADEAIRAGKREMDTLTAVIEQSSSLRSFLQSTQQAAWNSAVDETDSGNTGVQPCAKVRELVPEYTPAVDRMAGLVRSLEEVAPRELLSPDEQAHQLGAALGSSEVVLNPVPWSIAERFWIKIGIASIPLLRRILLERAWERHWERLQHHIQQTLRDRLRLLEEEYVRVIARIVERVKSAVSHRPKSDHAVALATLNEELQEAMRMACEEQSQAD